MQESAVYQTIKNNLQGKELQDATKDAFASRIIWRLTDNQDKAIDRSIIVCERTNSTKLWSYISTSLAVAEVAESMISHE